ncbi:MAG: Predicted dehydrogenase, partial [uncultured Thermomicrobiales bacterium]
GRSGSHRGRGDRVRQRVAQVHPPPAPAERAAAEGRHPPPLRRGPGPQGRGRGALRDRPLLDRPRGGLCRPGDRPRPGPDLDAGARAPRPRRAGGRQARPGREADGDDRRGGGPSGRAGRPLPRLPPPRPPCRPQPDLPGDVAAAPPGGCRHGPHGPRLLRLGRAGLGPVVLQAGRRPDVRPRRLQRDDPDRPPRPGQADRRPQRGRHPGAGGGRGDDEGRDGRQRPAPARLRRRPLRRRHHRLHHPEVPRPRDRALRQRWHDPDDRRRLGAQGLRALAEQGRLLADLRGHQRLAVDRRHPPPGRVRRDRDAAAHHPGACLPRAGDHDQVDGVRPDRAGARHREHVHAAALRGGRPARHRRRARPRTGERRM